MNIPYRTRRRLRKLGIVLLILIVIAAVLGSIWLFWLQRYVVYTRDGAKIDFSRSAEDIRGVQAVPPADSGDVSIYYNEGENALNFSSELTQIYGYYLDSQILTDDFETARSRVEMLPPGSVVMVDVKNDRGQFYYNSALGSLSDSVNVAEMEKLIRYRSKKNLYLIARVPAFRNYDFFISLDSGTDRRENISFGIWADEGHSYLYSDDDGRYWLDPASNGTINYLIKIVSELKQLGFNEVAFSDFHFPLTGDYPYSEDKTAVLNAAAANLVSTCATSNFAVSFFADPASFPLPEGRSRIYAENVSAVGVAGIIERAQVPDPAVNLVFVTEANDTRFDDYSVLRPITSMSVDTPPTLPSRQEKPEPTDGTEPSGPAPSSEPPVPSSEAE